MRFLQREAFRLQLLEQGLSEQDIADKTEAWRSAVGTRYAALGMPLAEGETPPSMRAQYDAVSAGIPVADDTLKQLGSERAAAAKRYLVNNGGLAADRAVVGAAEPNDDSNRFSGIELDIDA